MKYYTNISKYIKNYKYILFLSIFALSIRFFFIFWLGGKYISPDGYDWISIGSNVASGQGYGDTWRPPGYSTFLGLIFFLFGKSILAVFIFQAIIGTLNCLIIYKIGKYIFSDKEAKLAAFLFSFYPYSIAYTYDILSETLYMFFIALSILILFISISKKKYFLYSLWGIVSGITILIKPTILPFILFALIWLWWRTGNFKNITIALLFIIITLLPWNIRNKLYYKQTIPTISPMWLSLYGSNCDEALNLETMGELDTPMPNEILDKVIPKGYYDLLKLPRMEIEKVCKEKTLLWIKNNPSKFLTLIWKRLLHFWRLYPMMAYPWQKYVAFFTSGIYIIFGFLGLILSYKEWRKTSIFWGLFLIFTAVHLFFAVTIRYRIPIDQFVIIFASYTIIRLFSNLKGILYYAKNN